MRTKSGASAAVPANYRLIQLFAVLDRANGASVYTASTADAFALIKEDAAAWSGFKGAGSAGLQACDIFPASDTDDADVRTLKAALGFNVNSAFTQRMLPEQRRAYQRTGLASNAGIHIVSQPFCHS